MCEYLDEIPEYGKGTHEIPKSKKWLLYVFDAVVFTMWAAALVTRMLGPARWLHLIGAMRARQKSGSTGVCFLPLTALRRRDSPQCGQIHVMTTPALYGGSCLLQFWQIGHDSRWNRHELSRSDSSR
jgi:hypothetical protein